MVRLISLIALVLASCSDSPFALSDCIKPLKVGTFKQKIDYSKPLTGEYLAQVNYKNLNTGYSAYYQLKVSVNENELTTIHFFNGGVLDESHFNSGDMDGAGEFRFTDDREREFEVTLISPFDQYSATTDDEYHLNKEFEKYYRR